MSRHRFYQPGDLRQASPLHEARQPVEVETAADPLTWSEVFAETSLADYFCGAIGFAVLALGLLGAWVILP